MSIALLEPDLLRETVCQGCWLRPAVTKGLATGLARCGACADANVPARVDLFPPLGVYRLTGRAVGPKGPVRWTAAGQIEPVHAERHRGPGAPQSPPDPGPPLPSPAPTPTPGRPPV
ncbi:hypothetical protein FEF34_24555 [Streptomyces marianii]|uniref:Uncharacterized protein n=1 Tax=Streptomyces marianii TaxID=1817406 RepID=A0A5R9EA52_9ACTN|nr:hypothetical protein FEF34_24555 [Streptomyces marianii]